MCTEATASQTTNAVLWTPDPCPRALPGREEIDPGRQHDAGRGYKNRRQEPHDEPGRALGPVPEIARVVPDEAVAAAEKLERHGRNEHHAREHVQREERPDEDYGHALDGEQQDQERPRRSRQAIISFRPASSHRIIVVSLLSSDRQHPGFDLVGAAA